MAPLMHSDLRSRADIKVTALGNAWPGQLRAGSILRRRAQLFEHEHFEGSGPLAVFKRSLGSGGVLPMFVGFPPFIGSVLTCRRRYSPALGTPGTAFQFVRLSAMILVDCIAA
jgi:hypothetical protein